MLDDALEHAWKFDWFSKKSRMKNYKSGREKRRKGGKGDFSDELLQAAERQNLSSSGAEQSYLFRELKSKWF